MRECGLNWVVVVGEMLNEHNELAWTGIIAFIRKFPKMNQQQQCQRLKPWIWAIWGQISGIRVCCYIYVCKNGGSIRKLHWNDDYEWSCIVSSYIMSSS